MLFSEYSVFLGRNISHVLKQSKLKILEETGVILLMLNFFFFVLVRVPSALFKHVCGSFLMVLGRMMVIMCYCE